jgi:hypothetical protein
MDFSQLITKVIEKYVDDVDVKISFQAEFLKYWVNFVTISLRAVYWVPWVSQLLRMPPKHRKGLAHSGLWDRLGIRTLLQPRTQTLATRAQMKSFSGVERATLAPISLREALASISLREVHWVDDLFMGGMEQLGNSQM